MNWYKYFKISQMQQKWSPIDDREIEKSRSPQDGPSTLFPGNSVPKNYYTRIQNDKKTQQRQTQLEMIDRKLTKILTNPQFNGVEISRSATILRVKILEYISPQVAAFIGNMVRKGMKRVKLFNPQGQLVGDFASGALPDLTQFSSKSPVVEQPKAQRAPRGSISSPAQRWWTRER